MLTWPLWSVQCTALTNRMDHRISVKSLSEPIDLSLTVYSSVSNVNIFQFLFSLIFCCKPSHTHSGHSSIWAFLMVSCIFIPPSSLTCHRKSWTRISFPAAPTVKKTRRAKSSTTRWKEITSATWLRWRRAMLETVSKMIHSFFVVCHYLLGDIHFLSFFFPNLTKKNWPATWNSGDNSLLTAMSLS